MTKDIKFDWCIIDYDPLVYRCGFSIEKKDKETESIQVEPVHHAYYNINSMMKKILKLSKDGKYKGWLTSNDKSNFRFKIFPQYKSNRKDARKPLYYNELRDYLVKKWSAKIAIGQEADDACSIDHCELNNLGFDKEVYNSVLCSFDKDFNNVPGWHYNFVKDEVYYVDETQALRNFYLQILTGDNSDGIPRIKKGWKKKEIESQLALAKTEEMMYTIVYNEIKKNINEWERMVQDELVMRARLVWLRQKPDELWLEPNKR